MLNKTIFHSKFKKRLLSLNESIYMKNCLRKFFNLQEYEGKVLFKKYGLNVEECYLVKTTEEALYYSEKFKNQAFMKCQVHAGGRGKGHLTSGLQGGVQLCKTTEDVKKFSKQMLGHNLITIQTPKEGLLVKSLLIAEVIDVKKQFYLAILLDRQYQGPVVLSSNEGGMDIEEVAKKKPESIIYTPIDVRKGITEENMKNIVSKLNFTDYERTQAVEQIKKLYELFIKHDVTQLEINPWAADSKGKVKFF